MTVIPEGYGTDFWTVVGGSAWLGLLEWAITQPKIVAAFEKETGHRLKALAKGGPLDQMIDDASGRTSAILGSWCDWVTVNYWGRV